MVEKAIIEVLEGPDRGSIKVMYNPEEYTVTARANMTGSASNIQFNRADAEDFTVSLFFDTYEEKRDVREQTDKIASLVLPTVDRSETRQPPLCCFLWGSFAFKGLVARVEQNFTMFLETGIPVRAELRVTFKTSLTPQEDEEHTGREACRRLWTVKSGDRLDLIAYKTLKDHTQWRKIAEANDIANPIAFPSKKDLGTLLIIPDSRGS